MNARRGSSKEKPARAWDFWVDRGGTFTDVTRKPPFSADFQVAVCT
ncbi:MAG TPA: hypothetical protein VFE60_17590 [Roseiarcus sp.]|nr:hypothetical protein [Roseiarcus sp.]